MATANKASSKVDGVRFAEANSASATHSHVHFDEKLHDSVVMVIPESEGNFLVKVGFLKTQHRYEIVFTLPVVPGIGRDLCPAHVPNPYLQIKDLTPTPLGGLKVICEYVAHKEGVLCEEMLIVSESKEDVCLKVKVHARVLDRGSTMQEGPRSESPERHGVFLYGVCMFSPCLHGFTPDRHHGTPMLLEGVRCVGAELEYDSEQSDWQGFD